MKESSRKQHKMPSSQVDIQQLKPTKPPDRAKEKPQKTTPIKIGATHTTSTNSVATPKLPETSPLPARARTSSLDSGSSFSDTSVALDLPFADRSPSEQLSPRAGGKLLSVDVLDSGTFSSRRQSEEIGDRLENWWNYTSKYHSGMGPGPTNPDWSMGRSRRSSRSSWSTLVSASESQLDDGEIEDGGSANVSVVVRVRPLSEQETKRGDRNVVLVQTPSSLLVEGDKNKQFTFNHVFDGNASQQDVLDECGMKKLVEMALEGYSCTAFAYGQTGSGKTYTITGPQKTDGQQHTNTWGLIQHSLVYLFDMIRLSPKVSFYIKTSYLEIYNEQVKDLLNLTGKDSLPVRWSKDKGFYVENLFVMECETLDDMIAVLEEGLSQKAIATNNVNEHSSRSHTIMSISIESELPDPDDNDLYITKHGKLSFVDLAGSEKVKELGSSSELLSETTNINKSLLTLGNCISSLSDNRKRSGHIPYRDSKLTKLLADSLGGTGITLMIACISPSSYCLSESINTLRYAVRARRIKNKPVIRMDPREKLITSLKREVRLLRSENQYLRQRLEFPGTAQPSFRPLEPNNNHLHHQAPPQPPREESQMDGDLTPVQNGRMEVEEPKIERTEAPVEGGRAGGGGKAGGGQREQDTKYHAKSAADNSLYEMLQEYMVENETLRSENSDLHSVKEKARREQDSVARENDRLLKKLEDLERVFQTSPYSLPSTFNSRTSSGQSIGVRGNKQPSPLYPLQQSPPIKSQRSPQGQSHNLTPPENLVDRRHSDGSPWRQQSGELPPVDSIKGIPDTYRSSQQRPPPHLPPPQRDAPPTQRSFPSVSTQPPHHPPPTNHSYPRAHTNQSGLSSTHPPVGHSYPSTHRGSKKGSESRVSNTSQSYPPAPGSLQASYAGSMAPLQEDHYQAPPNVGKRESNLSVRSSLSNPSVSSKPQSKADIYIPSAPSTGLTKDSSPRRDPTNRHDLQTIDETGAQPASSFRNAPPPSNSHPNINQRKPVSTANTATTGYSSNAPPPSNSHSNVGQRKPLSTANTASTGYSNKSKKTAWSGAGGGGTGGGGGGSQPNKTATASTVPISNIPKTPAVTPPVVKYKPQGSNKMLAATTNNLDINYKGPDSDSLKDLNQKLREELQALDGEIEYMKYVNKNKPNAPAGKGKRR